MGLTKGELIEALRPIIREMLPEVAAGLPYQVKGRVIKVHETTVDVYVCDADGLPRDDMPPLAGVEVPKTWVGGVDPWAYRLPPTGSQVRVGFYYGDPSRPFVDAVIG